MNLGALGLGIAYVAGHKARSLGRAEAGGGFKGTELMNPTLLSEVLARMPRPWKSREILAPHSVGRVDVVGGRGL